MKKYIYYLISFLIGIGIGMCLCLFMPTQVGENDILVDYVDTAIGEQTLSMTKDVYMLAENEQTLALAGNNGYAVIT